MTWIAVSSAGPATCAGGPQLREEMLSRGSLWLEADLGPGGAGACTLLRLERRADVTSHISVRLTEAGAVVFSRRLGPRRLEVSLRAGGGSCGGVVRLSVSWNAPAKWGLISLEQVAEGALFQKEFADPLPWLLSDIDRLRGGARDVEQAPELTGFAVSDGVEPVGIAPSLGTGSPVLTPQGYRTVESLGRGDMVITDHGPRPVLWCGAREVPALGRFRPVTLHAPYFGLRRDVVVSPDQRLRVQGPEVEFLFGEEAVLVEAHALLGTSFAAHAAAGPTIRYHQVLLEDHGTLDVAGAQLESLFVGRLREMPLVLANTVLGDLRPEEMPLHPRLACPALRRYEAVTLRAALLNR